MSKMPQTIFILAVLICLAGCTLIPELEKPASPVPERYPSEEGYDPALMNNTRSRVLNDIAWENFFRDETVKKLIAAGLENNRDLKAAALAISEARARYGIEKSRLLPEVSGETVYTRQRIPGSQRPLPNSGATSETYSVSLDMTAYELDLFGRLRSLSEAALNDYLATEAARESVWISLISDIASAYIDYRADQTLLTLADETVRASRDALDLIRLRTEKGVASDLDLRQAETLLHAARVDRARYLNAVARDRNALRLLLGTPERMPDLDGPVVQHAFFNDFFTDVPAGMPALLLTSRPDIIQAEYALKAANANIGAARAAFFPTISLTTVGGYASGELSSLFDNDMRYWQFSPQIHIPIFTAGRLKKSLDVAEIRKNRAVLEYERTIEKAFREVADALSAVSTYDDQVKAQADLVAATESATRLSQLRYDAGVENYLTVLDARRQLYAARQALIRQKMSEMKARISLYKAVGGGRIRPETTAQSYQESPAS